jgi:hypothetical protein
MGVKVKFGIALFSDITFPSFPRRREPSKLRMPTPLDSHLNGNDRLLKSNHGSADTIRRSQRSSTNETTRLPCGSVDFS